MSKRVPGVPLVWECFISSLIFQLGLPILPLLLEYWLTNGISEHSLMLVASLYAISVGVSSSSRLFFGAGIVSGLIFAVAFGAITSGQTLANSAALAGWAIATIFVIHSCERWNLHIVDEKPYWNF